MLSDEEKKAIEIQDSISILENTDLDINNIYSIDLRTYNVAVKTVVEVIKKQAKEIEELKEESKEYQIGFAQGCYEKKLDWEDKIKAKIEESELLIDNSQGCMSDEDLYKEYGKIEFGQSLLGKE